MQPANDGDLFEIAEAWPESDPLWRTTLRGHTKLEKQLGKRRASGVTVRQALLMIWLLGVLVWLYFLPQIQNPYIIFVSGLPFLGVLLLLLSVPLNRNKR